MSDILPIIHLFPDGLSQLKDKGWYREETGILDHESSCAISGCEHSGSRPHYHYDYYDKTQQIPVRFLTQPCYLYSCLIRPVDVPAHTAHPT